ncbi:protein shisa-5 [Tupaia chinensis]|uniref:protein shisa-5 n=1 Tax=Tupaia chinensis TaxID=246437 RepID=UPI000FFB2C4E|nr:protein shisa-5 [Tupaia chinensis]
MVQNGGSGEAAGWAQGMQQAPSGGRAREWGVLSRVEWSGEGRAGRLGVKSEARFPGSVWTPARRGSLLARGGGGLRSAQGAASPRPQRRCPEPGEPAWAGARRARGRRWHLGAAEGVSCEVPGPRVQKGPSVRGATARGEVCVAFRGHDLSPVSCPDFCCGTCDDQYCCSDMLKRFVWSEQSCAGPADRWVHGGPCVRGAPPCPEALGLGFQVAHGVSDAQLGEGLALGMVGTVDGLGARPVVTTTATTVVHAPYPQPVSVPPSYPGPTYQGYHPMPHPGMPAAPYPTQYPPPYPAQPVGPPAYHETVAGGAAAPYPASQPPYNPAYMDPPKAAP